jgi:TadE-like protein
MNPSSASTSDHHRLPGRRFPTLRGEPALDTGCNPRTAPNSHAAWGTNGRPPWRRRNEQGQGTLEFMAMVPLVLAVLVAALQVMVLTYTAHAASQAAREAARARSLGQPYVAAAQASLPGAISLVSATPTGFANGVTVTVKAPPMLLITDTITRSVTMP